MLVTLDVIAGLILIVISVGLSLGVIFTVGQFPGLVAECGTTVAGGVPCESGGLVTTVVIVVISVAVFAAALGLGFFIVRLIQKRLAFTWPLLGIVATIVALYAGTAIVGALATS